MENAELVRKIGCELVNRLWLKIPVTTGPKTRAEASKAWKEILDGEGLGIVYDEAQEKFVLAEDGGVAEALEPSNNGDGNDTETEAATV